MIQYFEYFSGHSFYWVNRESIDLCFIYEFVIAWHGIFQYKSQGPFQDFFQFTDLDLDVKKQTREQ